MRIAILLLALMVVGCGSSPATRYYTLDPVHGTQVASAGAPIKLGHIELPATLDRQSIVTHGAGNRLEISGDERWAAPLDELARRALAEDLRARLPRGIVIAAGDPTPPGTRTLVVNVQRFMPGASGKVLLDVDWSVQHAGRYTMPRHLSIQTDLHGQGGEAVADAMSRALAQLADDIVQQI
jgi:uncharacterized protein